MRRGYPGIRMISPICILIHVLLVSRRTRAYDRLKSGLGKIGDARKKGARGADVRWDFAVLSCACSTFS